MAAIAGAELIITLGGDGTLLRAARFGSVVVPASATISLQVESDTPASLSIDGAPETPVQSGDVVDVCESPYKTRLLRKDSQRYFFKALRETLKYGLEP